jgi:hypothetical protein
MERLTELHEAIQSGDWNMAIAASAELVEIGGPDVLALLIRLLQSPSHRTRNAAACGLRDIADNAALEPLKAAVLDPKLKGYNGTLMYALETLDCSRELRFLFSVALAQDFEVQNHALTILSQQQFWYTANDLKEMQLELDAFAGRTDRRPETDILINDLRGLLDDLHRDYPA